MPVIINGSTGISGVDGSAASPAIEGSDTNTGMFFPAADTIAFATNATERVRISSNGLLTVQNSSVSTTLAAFSANFGVGTRSLTLSTPNTDSTTEPFFFDTGNSIAFSVDASERFRIGPAGQFGIAGANYGTSGQVLTSGGSGASPSWAAAGGMTLLGTITTTSGASQSLSGLTLTGYKEVVLVWQGVNCVGSTSSYLVGTSTADDVIVGGPSDGDSRGVTTINLTNGTFWGGIDDAAANASVIANFYVGDLPITTASTAISVAGSTGNFSAGSVLVYGIS